MNDHMIERKASARRTLAASSEAKVERPVFFTSPDELLTADSKDLVSRFNCLSEIRYFGLLRVGRHPGGLIIREEEETEQTVREVLEAGLYSINQEMAAISEELRTRRPEVGRHRLNSRRRVHTMGPLVVQPG